MVFNEILYQDNNLQYNRYDTMNNFKKDLKK